MKLTKNDLKAIVKECLLEILNEGLGNDLHVQTQVPNVAETRTRQPTFNKQPVTRLLQQRTAPIQNNALKRAVIDEAKGNAMMASILADTANTTLPNMLRNDRGDNSFTPVGKAEMIVDSSTPQELFGDELVASWANLAFADGPTKQKKSA